MESQAGRVVANEVSAILSEGGCQRLDEVGRQRLRTLCDEFHTQCRKISPGEEVRKLHSRIQALEANGCHTAADAGGQAEGGPADDPHLAAQDGGATRGDEPRDGRIPTRREPEQRAQREARLRVPTDRKAESWWNPRYWSIARPTDFCYGDCAWGIGEQPPHGDGPQKEERYGISVAEFIKNLFLREEMECDVPGDEEKYVAKATNRFRDSWYDVHLLHSFWRVTETTKSVHSWMKIPGAFGMARACAELKPEQLEEVILKMQQTGGKITVQSVLNDKDTPQQVSAALRSLQQATASLVGSDGHRRELRGEGEAYTLRYGPPWSSSRRTSRTRSST